MELATALRAQAAALRLQADALDALAALDEQRALAGVGSSWLDLRALDEGYGLKRDALLAAADRGELTIKRGPRRKILVERAEVERWLSSRPYVPRAPRITAPTTASNDDWELRAESELARLVSK